jgi:hypothetical protein
MTLKQRIRKILNFNDPNLDYLMIEIQDNKIELKFNSFCIIFFIYPCTYRTVEFVLPQIYNILVRISQCFVVLLA